MPKGAEAARIGAHDERGVAAALGLAGGSMASVIVDSVPQRARAARSPFYVGVALLVIVTVLAGFAPSFYSIAFDGNPRPWIMHVHAAVFLGWLVLLVCQTVVAARGKIALHKSIGTLGSYYAAVVWVLGVIVSFVAPAAHVRAGEWTFERAVTFLTIPLGDMVLFGSFFGAAILYRSRPEVHKRLVLLACVAIMFAGAFRLSYALNLAGQLAVWYLPIVACMGYDLYKRGRVHPVYWIGAAVMAVGLARIPFGETALWHGIASPLLMKLV